MTTFKPYGIITDELWAVSLNGGGTVSTVVGVSVPNSGYVVGVKDKGICGEAIPIKDLTDWVFSTRPISGLPGYFLGVWADEETDIVYLDVVQVFPERAVAERECKARGEIAYYSLHEGKEYRVA